LASWNTDSPDHFDRAAAPLIGRNSDASRTRVHCAEQIGLSCISEDSRIKEEKMKKYLFAAALIGGIATPVMADDVGVRVGPVGAGVTVGESHEYRDRDRNRTTVIKEREPRDRTTVIKKEDDMGNRSKTVIHHDND
jgi:hypothetical protein